MNIFNNTEGIAMTEGVIVIPFFIAVWLGMFSLYGYYSAGLDARGKATEAALGQSISGQCDDVSFNADQDAAATGFGADAGGGDDHRFDGHEVTGDSGVWDAAKDINPLIFQHVSASAEVTHEVYGRSRKADASRFMLCNSKPAEGILEMLIDSLKGALGL